MFGAESCVVASDCTLNDTRKVFVLRIGHRGAYAENADSAPLGCRRPYKERLE